MIKKLFNLPIPDLSVQTKLKRNYRAYPIDHNHKLYNEKCENIIDHGIKGKNYYNHNQNPPYYQKIPKSIPELYLRQTVLKKITTINKLLQKFNLELYFFDCYRPIEVQNYMHDKWVPCYLKLQHPNWSKIKILSETNKYWAKGSQSSQQINPDSPPPHSTGGAFDVTIQKNTGDHLYMGSIFDDPSSISNTNYFEKMSQKRDLTTSETEALKNRRLLYHIMVKHGFCSNPAEWWHFSYGDQMWAKSQGKPKAFYSVANLNM